MNSELKEMVENYLKKAKPMFENLEIKNPGNIDTKKFCFQKIPTEFLDTKFCLWQNFLVAKLTRNTSYYDKKISKEFREMAISYYHDAIHFFEKREYARALAALEYAEGWLDAGKRIGIFK